MSVSVRFNVPASTPVSATVLEPEPVPAIVRFARAVSLTVIIDAPAPEFVELMLVSELSVNALNVRLAEELSFTVSDVISLVFAPPEPLIVTVATVVPE